MKRLGALQRHQLPHPLAKILDPPLGGWYTAYTPNTPLIITEEAWENTLPYSYCRNFISFDAIANAQACAFDDRQLISILSLLNIIQNKQRLLCLFRDDRY